MCQEPVYFCTEGGIAAADPLGVSDALPGRELECSIQNLENLPPPRGGTISRRAASSVLKCLLQPAFGFDPIPSDGAGGYVQRLGGFLLGEAAEEPTFDHPAQALVEFPQLYERFIKREECVRPPLGHERRIIEAYRYRIGSALESTMSAGIVDEDTTHGARRDGKEVCPVRHVGPALVDELEVSLVDEGGGAECVIRALAPQVMVCDSAHLVVDELKEPLDSAVVARPPGSEQPRDVGFVAHLAERSMQCSGTATWCGGPSIGRRCLPSVVRHPSITSGGAAPTHTVATFTARSDGRTSPGAPETAGRCGSGPSPG